MRTITTPRGIQPPTVTTGQGRDMDAPAGSELHDMELMLQVRAGHADAFEAVVGRYWEATARYALHLVRDSDQASDIAQEAFARLWQRRETWESRGSVLVWLLRTARHLVVSDARRQSVRTRWAMDAAREGREGPPTPLQEMERTELREAIEEALRRLSPRRREAFTLFHIQQLSYREIGQIMEVRPQTVANYLQAAVAELRESVAPSLNAFLASELPER